MHIHTHTHTHDSIYTYTTTQLFLINISRNKSYVRALSLLPGSSVHNTAYRATLAKAVKGLFKLD